MESKYWKYINFVGHMESVAEDAERLLRQTGAWNEFGKSGWGENGDNAIFTERKRAANATDRLKEYLTPELERSIEEFYAEDYRNPVLNLTLKVFADQVNAATEERLVRTRESELASMEVQRIYYINLAKNAGRREQMEAWLGNQSIPFQRVNATIGVDDPEACVEGKQAVARCRGLSGVAMSNLDIIRNHNTSGLTLIFEDDFIVRKPLNSLVQKTLALVPADWDIIRWDCWGKIPSTFVKFFDKKPTHQVVRAAQGPSKLNVVVKTPVRVFRTAHHGPCNNTVNSTCEFYGGAYAMLWRGSSVQKLEKVWSQRPFEDIDGRLTTDQLNSYCVNFRGGIGKMSYPEGERTDIPKLEQVERKTA